MFRLIGTAAMCTFALIAASEQARAQVGVNVRVYNNTAAKIKGVFQSTDNDIATDCVAQSSSGSSNCIGSKTYKSPPKNIKNMLCISTKVDWDLTPTCKMLMDQTPGCKKNNIWTALCNAGYGTNVVPKCIYRTGSSGFSYWNWTVWLVDGSKNRVSIDCSTENYTVLKN